MGYVFFLLFAGVLYLSYISLRRELAAPRLTATVSVVGSAVTLTLFIISQRDASAIYSVVLGIFVGALFSGLTLALAWMFNGLETGSAREEYPQNPSPDDYVE